MLPLSTPARAAVAVMTVLAIAACSGPAAPPATTVAADRSPVEVVTELLAAVEEGRFEDTAALTDSTQAALLTLAEGANASEVANVLEDESGAGVVANFWSGFAQTLDTSFRLDRLRAGEPVTEGDSEFVEVTLSPENGEPRRIVVRRDGTWQVDLFATFGTILAERLVPLVESVQASANADASIVLDHLDESADSLRMAASDPALSPNIHQSLLALIERVTRAGG